MNSTDAPKDIAPDDALIARADERLAHAYEQITRADEQLARMTEQLAKMERDAVPRPSSVKPGSTKPGPQTSPPGTSALRAFVGLMLAACIFVVAAALQSSSGAKSIVSRWAPQFVSAASLPPENPPSPAPPASSGIQVATAEAAPPQAAAGPQTAPQDAAPTAAAAPDQTQLLQTMARDLANAQKEIEQLKANQLQMASDNSKAVEQLKAIQQDMQRQLATVSDHNPPKTVSDHSLPKVALPPPKQPTATSRKPERTLHSVNARSRSHIPREWLYDDW